MTIVSSVVVFLLSVSRFADRASGFVVVSDHRSRRSVVATTTTTARPASHDLDGSVCEQMTLRVCASTSCAKKRRVCGLDEFATFGALYERAGDCGVEVEESPCLGKCQLAPCVAVQHEDYEGHIGLEGMTDAELSLSLFTGVLTEGDCDRIWDAVENGVRTLAEMEDDE